MTLGFPKNKYNRWHRYNVVGEKEIKSFEIGHDPNIDGIPTGYTAWVKGNGKMNEEQYNKILDHVNRNFKGKPKPLSQKLKMREAKLGVPKSLEHRKNMSISQQRRRSNNK